MYIHVISKIRQIVALNRSKNVVLVSDTYNNNSNAIKKLKILRSEIQKWGGWVKELSFLLGVRGVKWGYNQKHTSN